jgi:hypothetical protein
MGKQVVVKIDVCLSRIKHHPIAIKNNHAYFLLSAHDYSLGKTPRVETRGFWLVVVPIRLEKEHSLIERRFDNPSCPRKRASRFQAFYGSYLDSRFRGNDKGCNSSPL